MITGTVSFPALFDTGRNSACDLIRFELHYTLKKGSWLNIAELELSALSRLCLGRRLASLEKLDHEVQVLVKERNTQQCKVTWQFSIPQAREKLKRHYEKVKPND